MQRSRGITLVETLVVISIISVMAGLLFVGLQASRESARRLQCSNNVKQIGVALQMYYDAQVRFPSGYIPGPLDDAGKWAEDYACYSWAAQLLPYLDQGPLFEELDVRSRSLHERMQETDATSLLSRRLDIFTCPSDLAGDTFASAPVWQGVRRLNRKMAGPPIFAGTSSYVANCGYFEPVHPFSPFRGTVWPRKNRKTGPNNGPFFSGSETRLRDVKDGATNTIAIGERAFFQASSMWVGTGNILGTFEGGAGVCLGRVFWRINELPDPPGVLITPGSNIVVNEEATAREGFSSYHPGGANFLFVDGSVRFLNEMIESRNTTSRTANVVSPVPDAPLLGAFQRLGVMDDGQPVTY